MTDDDLTSAWATSRDTGTLSLDGTGFARQLEYGVRDVRYIDQPVRKYRAPIKRHSSHAAFVPRPVTVGETPQAEGDRMRRDPMSATRRHVVPFYKINGEL